MNCYAQPNVHRNASAVHDFDRLTLCCRRCGVSVEAWRFATLFVMEWQMRYG